MDLFGWYKGTLANFCIDPADRADITVRQIFKGGVRVYPVFRLPSLGIVNVSASYAAVPARRCVHGIERGLANLCVPTDRTGVGLWKIFKCGARRNSVLGFAPGRVIDITTGFTPVRLHLFRHYSQQLPLHQATGGLLTVPTIKIPEDERFRPEQHSA
jgi:hypothetical protein